jgi:adenosylcobinamide-GDP ribazoletransferase
MIIALSFMEGYFLFQALLVSEIMAKFSMVLMASLGQSAALGSNSPFVQLMKNKKKLAMALALTIIPIIVVAGIIGMIVFAAGIVLTLFLVGISTRSFGGITGDVLGATNEFTRLTSLLIFVTL